GVGLLSPLRSPEGGVGRKAAAQDRWRMPRRAAVNIRIMLVDLHQSQRLSKGVLGQEIKRDDFGCRVDRISRADDDRVQLAMHPAKFTFCLFVEYDRDERRRGGEQL